MFAVKRFDGQWNSGKLVRIEVGCQRELAEKNYFKIKTTETNLIIKVFFQ